MLVVCWRTDWLVPFLVSKFLLEALVWCLMTIVSGHESLLGHGCCDLDCPEEVVAASGGEQLPSSEWCLLGLKFWRCP